MNWTCIYIYTTVQNYRCMKPLTINKTLRNKTKYASVRTDNQEEVLEMRLKASEKKSLCWEFLNQAAVSEVINEPSSSTMIIISIINTHTLHKTRGDRAIAGKWKHFWNRWLFLCETVNIFSNQQRTVCGYQHKPASIIYSTALWTPDTPQGTIGSHCIEKHYSLHRRICHKTTALYHIIVCVCVCFFFYSLTN